MQNGAQNRSRILKRFKALVLKPPPPPPPPHINLERLASERKTLLFKTFIGIFSMQNCRKFIYIMEI